MNFLEYCWMRDFSYEDFVLMHNCHGSGEVPDEKTYSDYYEKRNKELEAFYAK